MDDVIVDLFENSLGKVNSSVDKALSETIQSIALLGLSRSDFFHHAAFYGGTALRIAYKLDRFSEDLDFSLKRPSPDFAISRYLDSLIEELEAFGFSIDVYEQKKTRVTPIQSAFIKANTKLHSLRIGLPERLADRIHANKVCKVKLEIDVDPPPHARFETAYIDEPVPYSLLLYSGDSIFAGKMDAVLSRGWKNRVKGRDWYDFAFLVRKKIPLLLPHLEARLRQKGIYTAEKPLNEADCRNLIRERIETVDLQAAKEDVLPFVRRPEDLDVWSKEYFYHVLDTMVYTS